MNRRFKDGFSGQISYTLGKAMDTGSDVQVGGLPVDARALDLEWAAADFDVRHRFVVNWLWEIPLLRDATGLTGRLLGGWQVNGITALQSGFPFTCQHRVSAIRTATTTATASTTIARTRRASALELPNDDRQAYINGLFVAADFPRPDVLGDLPRNAYRGPGFASTDLSLFKNFALPSGAMRSSSSAPRSFNVFNRVNLRLPNGNMAQATFGRSTQAFAAREMQFALKLIF